MLFKSKAIVLNQIKYRETSIITKIYTEEFGLQTYIVNSVRSKTSKTKIALFQPLTLLDLVVYHKANGGIQRISEVKCSFPYKSIPFEISKSVIAIFLAEILNKTLKEEVSNPHLFYFLQESFIQFDQQQNGYENFHLKFLIELSAYLGFLPSSPNDIIPPYLVSTVSSAEKDFLNSLIKSSITDSIKADNFTRRNTLEYLLAFYAIHVENFGTVNSVKVLKDVLTG